MKSTPVVIAILVSALLVSLIFTALDRFVPMRVIPCAEPWAGNLILSLLFTALLQLFFARRIPGRRYAVFIAGHFVLILPVLWLGLYAVSPLGYSSGAVPNLRGFEIVRMSRTTVVENNQIVSLVKDSPVGINPLLLDENSRCNWVSSAGAELDGDSDCFLIYNPPGADHDILRLRIRSACGLPDSTARIRIAILP